MQEKSNISRTSKINNFSASSFKTFKTYKHSESVRVEDTEAKRESFKN